MINPKILQQQFKKKKLKLLPAPTLQELQKFWYHKLKESGFHDIEQSHRTNPFLRVWSSRFFKDFSADQCEERATYYELARTFLHQHRFKSKIEEQIWYFHSEGFSTRAIVEELKKNKINRCHGTIHNVIKALVPFMKVCVPPYDQESSEERSHCDTPLHPDTG